MKLFTIIPLFAGLAHGMNMAQKYLSSHFGDDHNDKLMIMMNPAFKEASFDQAEQMKMILPHLMMDAKENENIKLLYCTQNGKCPSILVSAVDECGIRC